jgi:dGTPase
MYATREQLEEIEAQSLAPFALCSRQSKGRRYPDAEPRYRTAFQRDRDRIIHSAAFRRLEYKTQVFVNDEGDYYRTRLTHTLEVAQIARTVARALRVNEDLVEAITLAHDLGHPPFGHAGEDALDALLKDDGGFNHNHQSYRVVTELEERYGEHPGLNLTYETLAGIAKHETNYDLSHVAGLDPDTRGSLEAQIADACDSLAYNAHDLDDGLRAELFTPSDLEELEIWRTLCDRLDWHGEVMDEITRHTFVRELVGLQVDDILTCTSQNLDELNPQSPEDIQNAGRNMVSHSEEMRQQTGALKKFLYENMYYHFRVIRMKKRGEQFINGIYESLVQEPRQLPPECTEQLQDHSLHRVVADYIASMTDRGALLEYRRLYDPVMRP